jgi:hypothetical protein
LTDDRLDGVMKLIECDLLFKEDVKKIDLKLRVAKTGIDTFYYDLTNPKWEIVKITSEGWNTIKNNEIPLFKRYENNCIAQVYPSNENKEQAWNRFLRLFNLNSCK